MKATMVVKVRVDPSPWLSLSGGRNKRSNQGQTNRVLLLLFSRGVEVAAELPAAEEEEFK
jgi:hypothetical protein